MKSAIDLQEQHKYNDDCDITDNHLNKQSYKFRKRILITKGWIHINNTKDGYNYEIWINNKFPHTYIINKPNGRTFCFTTDINHAIYWYNSEVIFECIMNNLSI